MFQSNNTQYINIKKYDQNLKIDNHIFSNGNIIKTEHSSFLLENQLCADAAKKLNILQQDIPKTYLTTICESPKQKIVDDDFIDDSFEIRRLTGHLNVAIPKQDLTNNINYFNSTGLDYIFSPFNILYNHLLTHGANTNSLNVLILNSTIYALILDEHQKIIYSSIKTVTAFNDIQSSQFYSDGIEGQQLFDEVHSLEIQEILITITNEFYEQNSSELFCESIAIFYTVKQLTDIQIDKIQESMMLEIEYSTIAVDDYLFSLTKQLQVATYSFIPARKKQDKKPLLIWILGAIVSTAIVVGILYFMQLKEDKEIQKAKEEQIKAAKRAKAAQVNLPNHKMNNEKLSQLILKIFDTIPDDVVLNEIQLLEEEVTLLCNFVKENTFTQTMQSELLKLYKSSDILLIQHNEPVYNVIVASSHILPAKLLAKQVQPKYKKDKTISKEKVITQIQAFLPKESAVTYKSTKKSKFITYNFHINTTLQTPKEFFDFVNELNNKSYSLNVTYPVEFVQTTKGLETTFNLKFHQFQSK